MKIKLGILEKEEFTSAFAIVLEDGTILKTRSDWVWSSSETKKKEMAAFLDFIEEIQRLGVEVEGLKELKETIK